MSQLNILIILLTTALAVLSLLYLRSRTKNMAAHIRLHNTITLLKMETIRNRVSHHFFFNALSGLSAPEIDTGTVSLKIKTLLMLLRKSVDNIEQMSIPVAEELEVVKGYIRLYSDKIPEPFQVTWDIDPETNMNHPVPAMILQIPVENAIKHGLLAITGDKLLRIGVANSTGGILITIEDNGTGYRNSTQRSMGGGTGLKILFQTISLLNAQNTAKIEFTIKDLDESDKSRRGTSVEIRIPDDYNYDIL